MGQPRDRLTEQFCSVNSRPVGQPTYGQSHILKIFWSPAFFDKNYFDYKIQNRVLRSGYIQCVIRDHHKTKWNYILIKNTFLNRKPIFSKLVFENEKVKRVELFSRTHGDMKDVCMCE